MTRRSTPAAPPDASVPRPAGTAAAFTAVTFWGLGNTLIASIPMSGLAVAFYRLVVAVAVYVPILYLRGGRLSIRGFRLGWAGGVAFGANLATFFVAIRLTTVANATTIAALQPLVIMGFAAAMFGERIRPRHAVASVVAIVGVALVAFGAAAGGTGSLGGDLMAGVALLTWAAYFITSKRARTELDTFEYMTVMNIVALGVVAPLALFGGQLSPDAGGITLTNLLAISLIVAVPGSGHILMNWAHGHSTLIVTSLATLLIPVLSTLSAAVFLDQGVTATQVAGIVVVLVALAGAVVGDARAAPRVDSVP